VASPHTIGNRKGRTPSFVLSAVLIAAGMLASGAPVAAAAPIIPR
jgi:hypothetical protein